MGERKNKKFLTKQTDFANKNMVKKMKTFIYLLSVLFFFFTNTFTQAKEISSTSKYRKLLPLEKIYKNKTKRNKKTLQIAKKIRENKNTPIVAVLDCGIYYKDRDIAYKLLRPEESELSHHLTKSPDQLLDSCSDKLRNDNYSLDELREEIADLKNLFYEAYIKKSDYSSENDHGTIVAKLISEGAGDVLILPTYMPPSIAGQKNTRISSQHLAIELFVKQGANIINLSVGAPEDVGTFNPYALLFYKKMSAKYPHILFIILAGNEGSNLANLVSENLDLPNVITVGAVDRDLKLADYSNYGSNVVDVAAYGHFVIPIDADTADVLQGTSFAAPRVTALAAKIKKTNPKLSAKQIKKIICDTATKTKELSQIVRAGGVINIDRALHKAKHTTGYAKKRKPKKQECFLDIFKHDLLHLAASNGYKSLARFSIDQGAKVDNTDNSNNTPFYEAATNSHYEIARLLADLGANINTKDLYYGRTPLLYASYYGNVDAVRFLIDLGTNLNESDNQNGGTPLMRAIDQNYENIAKMLIDASASIDEARYDGSTPLHPACLNGNENIVRMLIDHAINTKGLKWTKDYINKETTDFQRIKAIYLARQNGHTNIVHILNNVLAMQDEDEL